MQREPGAAVVELRELEKLFPDFEMSQVCLGKGLPWQWDAVGAEAEFRKAAALDPSDPEVQTGLGSVRDKQHDFDGALEE